MAKSVTTSMLRATEGIAHSNPLQVGANRLIKYHDVVQAKNRAKFPWIMLLIFLATVYLFWIYPVQVRNRPVDVEFKTEGE